MVPKLALIDERTSFDFVYIDRAKEVVSFVLNDTCLPSAKGSRLFLPLTIFEGGSDVCWPYCDSLNPSKDRQPSKNSAWRSEVAT